MRGLPCDVIRLLFTARRKVTLCKLYTNAYGVVSLSVRTFAAGLLIVPALLLESSAFAHTVGRAPATVDSSQLENSHLQ